MEQRIAELERSTREQFQEQDGKIDRIFDLIRQFVQAGGQQQQRRMIGFKRQSEDAKT
ncbi:MAG: hypothetical protein AAB316_12190 [Bacteroidota bacterium]